MSKVALFYIPPDVDIDAIEVPKLRVKMKFKDFVQLPEYLQIACLDNAEQLMVRKKKKKGKKLNPYL